ncbi:WD40-repeat-containing domain protein [Hypoxylon sp. FL1857]|nr:WD40-repeat-containing domain protein [Hypoxylon sp. FL1857]
MKFKDSVRRRARRLLDRTEGNTTAVSGYPTLAQTKENADGSSLQSNTTHTTHQQLEASKAAILHDTRNQEAKDASFGRNLWADAYEMLRNDEERYPLLEHIEKYLKEDGNIENVKGKLLDADGTDGDAQHLEVVQELEKFTFSIRGRRLVARELLCKAIRVLSKFKDVVSSAISAEPHAEIAWAGVMAILPLLENAYQQDEDAANGLNEILFLLIRYQEMQEGFLSLELQGSHQPRNSSTLLPSIRSQVVSVYADILVYQIRFLLQFNRNMAHRFVRDIGTADGWKQMWTKIETASQRIDQGVRDRLNTRILESWKAVGDIKTMVGDLSTAVKDAEEERLLMSLPYTANAIFDSRLVVDSANPCLERTQRHTLKCIQDWAEDPNGELVFWLHGMAGTGKTSVALTVANALKDGNPFVYGHRPPHSVFLGASFFFKQGDITRNGTEGFFPTIARCLAESLPDLKSYIVSSIKEHFAIGTKAPQQQLQHLIIKPLLMLDKRTFPPTRLLVIIDALDECEKLTEAEELLGMIAGLKAFDQVQLRILITSRSDDNISRSFKQRLDGMHRAVPLENISLSIKGDDEIDDITLYLTKTLAEIAENHGASQDCISRTDIEQLSKKADGLFIYAATTCRFLSNGFEDDNYRQLCLKLIVNDDKESSPLQKVDEIYVKHLKSVRYLDDVLGRLHSVVYVPQDENAPLGLIRLSFRDFLLSEERSAGLPFHVKELSLHRAVLDSCLRVMSRDLHQDMCKLLLPGSLASEVSPSHLEENVPHYLRYACCYWVYHLAKLDETQREEVGLEDNGLIHAFLLKNMLYWLETMSLIRETSNAVLIINRIQTLVDPVKQPKLSALMYDAGRFVLMNKWIIDYAPLQIYCSALLFSPKASPIRSTFKTLMPSWITQKPKVPEDWDYELSVLEGHTGGVSTVAFSPTDDLLASGSRDGIIIWDYVTGTERFKFDVPSPCKCTFSRDGNLLAFGSINGEIKVMEFSTGAMIELPDHSALVGCLAFSPKANNILASSSSDGAARVWDIEKALALHTLKPPPYKDRKAITFSPDGKLLAGCVGPDSVGLWNVETGKRLWDTINNRNQTGDKIRLDRVRNIEFLPADDNVICAASTSGIQLWDISGKSAEPRVAKMSWRPASFSRDGRFAALAFGHFQSTGTIELWDGNLKKKIVGIPEWHSAVFSPDGNHMALRDLGSMAILECTTLKNLDQFTIPHIDSGSDSFKFSPDSQLICFMRKQHWDSIDGKFELWNLRTVRELFSYPPFGSAKSIAFSPNGDLVSFPVEGGIALLETETGKERYVLKDETNITGVKFHPEGHLVAIRHFRIGDISVWPTSNAKDAPVFKFELPKDERWDIVEMAISTTGILMAASNDEYFSSSTIVLLNISTGETIGRFRLQTYDIHDISISADSHCFESSIGRLPALPPPSIDQNFHSKDISEATQESLYVEAQWVVQGFEKLLWLPPAYRANSIAVKDDLLVIGHEFGSVTILKFDLAKTPLSSRLSHRFH